MSDPTSPTPSASAAPTLTVPMGFGAQIKALQETQRVQALRTATLERENATQTLRIAILERENAALKASIFTVSAATSTDFPTAQHPPSPTLLSRIEALENHNHHLTQRRKEAVAQLLNLRTLHQEASNAFAMRATDIQEDDLEGMLGVYGTSMTTVLNQHQRALGQMRGSAQIQRHYLAAVAGGHGGYAYPQTYGQSGYCHAHSLPYPCHVCGQ